jgi:hypothetical protein
LFTATCDCLHSSSKAYRSVGDGSTAAAYRSSGAILIRGKLSTTKRFLAVAWYDLPARINYGSIKQVRTASNSQIVFDWLRRDACIRAVHEACAMVTCWFRFSRQYTPCNFSAHSSHLYFEAHIRPLLDYIGPYPRGSSGCVPTEPRTKHF